MDELFLQYLWKFQKFEGRPFRLTNGSTLLVFDPGFQNHNSGPDFLEAKIRIDEIDWVGAVEIHHKASDWILHKHEKDQKYESVILHVVWSADKEITLSDGSTLPTFQMADYQNGSLGSDYRQYINQPTTIKCASFLNRIDSLTKTNMLDQALVERLAQKANQILEAVKIDKGDWEKVTFKMLSRNFGFSVNNHAFETWASSFDYSLLHRYGNQPDMCFALAFGMAGFLENPVDNYSQALSESFTHLKKKHDLDPILQRHHWKFSRLRPANFPTVRLAELVNLFIHEQNLFSSIIGIQDVGKMIKTLETDLPDYWKIHYDFGQNMSQRTNNLGKSSIEVLIINVMAPLLAAYSKYLDDNSYMNQAIEWLNVIRAEKNKIIREWETMDIKISNAADSQALIHRYKAYCISKKCLSCNIGIAILHSRG